MLDRLAVWHFTVYSRVLLFRVMIFTAERLGLTPGYFEFRERVLRVVLSCVGSWGFLLELLSESSEFEAVSPLCLWLVFPRVGFPTRWLLVRFIVGAWSSCPMMTFSLVFCTLLFPQRSWVRCSGYVGCCQVMAEVDVRRHTKPSHWCYVPGKKLLYYVGSHKATIQHYKPSRYCPSVHRFEILQHVINLPQKIAYFLI